MKEVRIKTPIGVVMLHEVPAYEAIGVLTKFEQKAERLFF